MRLTFLVVFCGAGLATAADANSTVISQARSAFERSDYSAAELLYRQALKAEAESPQVWNALGVTLNREQRFDEAAEAFRSALNLAPSIEGLQLNLGIALFRAGKLEAAAQSLAPLQNMEQARELLALSYNGLGDYQRALPLLESIAATSIDPTMHIALAKCYQALGRPTDVERAMAHMLQVVPDSAPLHVALGDAYGDSDREKAIAEYRKAASLDASLAGVHLRIGRLLWRVRQFDEAEPEFQAELKCDPGSADPKYYLGTMFLYRDDARRAIPLLQEFVRIRPQQQNGFFELGRALFKDKQIAAALAAFERAALLGPDDPQVHFQLAQTYRTAGRLAEAKREMALSQRLRATKLDQYNLEFQSEAKKIANKEKE